MKDYIREYRAYLTEIKKSSVNTLEAYIRDVSQFIQYCTEKKIHDVSNIDENVLKKYLTHLAKIGKSEATGVRITASLRGYFRFLVSENIIDINPAQGIKTKKAAQKLPGVLESNEILLLLSQPNGDDYKSIRDKAMLELLYATGIKVSELIELTLNDVNLQLGILHMHQTKHERIVPVYPAAARHLSEYITSVRPAIVQNEDEDRLFTNMNGAPMSRQGFWKIIKHYADMAGIHKDITPHTLRHSFAAHLLENGAQLSDIKEMLGHSDISSTQIYAQFIKNKYVRNYAKFHPLAK